MRLIRGSFRVLVLLYLHTLNHLLGLGSLLGCQQAVAVLCGAVDTRKVRPVCLEQVCSVLLVAHITVSDIDLLFSLGFIMTRLLLAHIDSMRWQHSLVRGGADARHHALA